MYVSYTIRDFVTTVSCLKTSGRACRVRDRDSAECQVSTRREKNTLHASLATPFPPIPFEPRPPPLSLQQCILPLPALISASPLVNCTFQVEVAYFDEAVLRPFWGRGEATLRFLRRRSDPWCCRNVRRNGCRNLSRIY